jgi:hypothetical protein
MVPFFLHLPVHYLHHLQELLLGEYPFLHEQMGEGFLSDGLGLESYTLLNNSTFRGPREYDLACHAKPAMLVNALR